MDWLGSATVQCGFGFSRELAEAANTHRIWGGGTRCGHLSFHFVYQGALMRRLARQPRIKLEVHHAPESQNGLRRLSLNQGHQTPGVWDI